MSCRLVFHRLLLRHLLDFVSVWLFRSAPRKVVVTTSHWGEMSTMAEGVTPAAPDPHSGLRQRKPGDNESTTPDSVIEPDENAKDKEEVNWGKTASGQGM